MSRIFQNKLANEHSLKGGVDRKLRRQLEEKKQALSQEKQELTNAMKALRKELAMIGNIEQDSIRYEKQQRNKEKERGVKREDGRDR